jgi:hypothetical protein
MFELLGVFVAWLLLVLGVIAYIRFVIEEDHARKVIALLESILFLLLYAIMKLIVL